MDSNFVFRPVDEDGLCPTFAIQQAVDDNTGIGATKLYKLLSSTVGCSERTAMRAVAKAVRLSHVRREEHGGRVTFHPAMVTNGSVTIREDEAPDDGNLF